MNPLECVVDAASAGERLDVFLSRLLPELSRSSLQKALTAGAARINDRAASKNYRLRAGDRLVFELPEVKPLCVEAQDIPLDVVYEDDDLLVINKPKGMVVHLRRAIPTAPWSMRFCGTAALRFPASTVCCAPGSSTASIRIQAGF